MTGCSTTSDGEHKSLIPLPWKHKVTTRHGDIDPSLPKLPAAGSGRGGYYQDDGPGDNPPPGLRDLPDAVVKYEPYAKFANKPYSVFGQTYTPLLNDEPFTQRGVASWYGVKFHGQRTSSGEPYDMYKMTAAHPTLPIPSYARVTSLDSGKSVVVRINDRGPFHSDRIVDVSYTAALKLGLLGKGSHQVEVERLFPDDPTRIATVRRAATSAAQAAPAPAEIAALMLEDRVAMDSAAVARSQPAAAKAAPASGYYLQLGAYGREGKAEEIGEMLKKSGVSQALEVVRSGSVNRLYSGPFETRAMAQEAARALPSSLGLKPIVVRR
ncbi:Endolytic peptidoglycan transglycosylase RlpA [Massilia sp. Bi118]|uniref:septal ring lytic transglycosylase RlpA family protein n=1 Tax=Massilia sp. Bi118 TaxID=2822346 RepID=UPI001D91FDC0|nr:septal ring lytic transglycosylase RlpA family protein [Massilia sp. Bi118]CAH0152674.1 Endolytic peptidoglycan transglycosylase RlpA [Massilia sp. Bi118]